jgi:hypothetical protein
MVLCPTVVVRVFQREMTTLEYVLRIVGPGVWFDAHQTRSIWPFSLLSVQW